MNLPTPTEYTTLSPYVLWSNADPGDVNAPIFIEPPDSIAGTGNQLWIALSGASGNWGGCVVWMSLDGIEYSDVGSVFAPTEMGILTAALATHADPDNTNQLKVDLTESLAELVSVSAADKDSLRSLCWVDGELVSFQNSTQTGPFAYTLDTLRRGAYATPIGTHAINATFVRFDDNILKLPLKGSLVGQTLYFKFTSFNKQGGGAQTLDDVGPYTYMFLGHFNNFVQIVKNDAVFAPVLEVSGLTAKTPVHGVGGAGTAVLITKSDGSTRSLGPFADLTGLALSTDFACMYNPHTASIYTLTDSVQIAIAVGNGHVFFNIFTTPDNAGAGAGSGGGDGSGFGGCPEETMYVSDDSQAKDVDRGLVLDCLDKGWLPAADKPTSIFGKIRARVAEWMHRWKRPIQWVASSVEPGIRLVTANGAELIISESTPVPTLENLELASIDDTNAALYAKGVQEGWHALTDVGNGLEWSKLSTVERVGMIRVRRFYVGSRNFKAGRVPGKWIFSHNVRLVGK
jgi:hypothetical protein